MKSLKSCNMCHITNKNVLPSRCALYLFKKEVFRIERQAFSESIKSKLTMKKIQLC